MQGKDEAAVKLEGVADDGATASAQETYVASRKLLQLAGVTLEQFKSTGRCIQL